ncbi:MAG: heavy metal translocating P-type ATPase [Lautropia sp.]|nr:heavy metal translocating P-type ATPase [Lautropia sp.]
MIPGNGNDGSFSTHRTQADAPSAGPDTGTGTDPQPHSGAPDAHADTRPPAGDAASRFGVLDDPGELSEHARPLRGQPGHFEAILAIDAVHCAACTQTIGAAIDDDHARIEVNVVSRRARLVWDSSQHRFSTLLQRLEDIGYPPRPLALDMVERADPRPRRRALWRMLVGVFCMMQVMMFAVPRYMGGDDIPADIRQLMIWAEAMLTVPALLFAAGPFFSGAWNDMKQRRIGMDTPVALGIAITVGTSAIAFHQGREVYFDSVTMIIGLLLVARWIESMARERAAASLGNSLARLPESADRVRVDGSIERVSRRRLQPGDRISVPAGATFVVDGRILEGSTEVDESLLTGESEPQPRQPGSTVVSGSINLRHPLLIEVLRRASDSRLAELHRLIDRASTSRPAILRQADRLAGPFLIAVLIIAALAAAAWWFIEPARAPWIAAAILIVTCPCALALAAPSALLTMLGGLARRGIIIDRSDTLEALARSDIFLFDKTGTLTTSTPVITLTGVSPGFDPADALAIASGIEHSSLHPVARAFAAAAAREGVKPVLMADPESGIQEGDAPIARDSAGAPPSPAGQPAEAHAAVAGMNGTSAAAPLAERLCRYETTDVMPAQASPSAAQGLARQARIQGVEDLPGGGLCARLLLNGHPWHARIIPQHDEIVLEIRPLPDKTHFPSDTAPTLPEADTAASTGAGDRAGDRAGVGRRDEAGAGTGAGTRGAGAGTGPGTPAMRATFHLTESLRAGATETLARLRAEGVHCLIVSGDHASRVARIAGTLDLSPEDTRHGARPEDKLDTLRGFQAAGQRVTMIGDGVNDAPVLSRADISVSMASATPLAQHHADILLLGDRLDDLLVARDGARRAMHIVRQNLLFSCLYNALSIPLAAAGLVPPWLAGLGMAGSSLVVVLNALRASRA